MIEARVDHKEGMNSYSLGFIEAFQIDTVALILNDAAKRGEVWIYDLQGDFMPLHTYHGYHIMPDNVGGAVVTFTFSG